MALSMQEIDNLKQTTLQEPGTKVRDPSVSLQFLVRSKDFMRYVTETNATGIAKDENPSTLLTLCG